MTGPDDANSEHVSNQQLIRLLDDELDGGDALTVEAHLTICALCHERFSNLRRLSSSFDSFLSSLRPEYSAWERQQLIEKLDRAAIKMPAAEPRPNWKRIGWGIAAAAALVIGTSLLPQRETAEHRGPAASYLSQTAPSNFEVDGETFAALPYSNPDLPLSAPHIVRMQVPVSSLADAGIYVEPISNGVATPGKAVLANVLLGLDGQPLGVHVLTTD